MDKNNIKQELIDFLKDLVIIVIIVVFIRTFLIEPFQISGPSMYATYYDKEFIIVDRFSYLDIPFIKTGNIEKGDVIVFRPGVDESKEYFIKRVVATGGDEIKFDDGDVFIKKPGEEEFTKLDESAYLTEDNNGKTRVKGGDRSFVVPEGKYFVMGDNRNSSSDSRSCFGFSCAVSTRDAFLSKSDITGKVFLDLGYFSFSKFSFTHPDIKELNTSTNLLEPISTKPKWFSSHSTHDYN